MSTYNQTAAIWDVPIIGRKERQRVQKSALNWHNLTKVIAVIKPQRVLGAVWTHRKVSDRRPVVMCPACVNKYDRWWKKEHYRPDWGFPYMGDCDGCGEMFCHVTLFHAEEKFYTVLTDAHGRASRP